MDQFPTIPTYLSSLPKLLSSLLSALNMGVSFFKCFFISLTDY